MSSGRSCSSTTHFQWPSNSNSSRPTGSPNSGRKWPWSRTAGLCPPSQVRPGRQRLIPDLLRELSRYRNKREFSRRLRQNQLAIDCNSIVLKLSIQSFYSSSAFPCSSKTSHRLSRLGRGWSNREAANEPRSPAKAKNSQSGYAPSKR